MKNLVRDWSSKTGSGNDILGDITCKSKQEKESFLGENLCLDIDSTGELLFPWGRHYLLVNNDLGRGVIIY